MATSRLVCLLLAIGVSLSSLCCGAREGVGPVSVPRCRSPRGYSFVPPAGWQVATPYLTPEELGSLPPSLRERYDPETTDILVMDTAPQPDGGSFFDNINVTIITDAGSFGDVSLTELQASLDDTYRTIFPDFRWIEPATPTRLGGYPAIRVQGSYQLQSDRIRMFQLVVFGPDFAVVMTCSADAVRIGRRQQECLEAFESLALDGQR